MIPGPSGRQRGHTGRLSASERLLRSVTERDWTAQVVALAQSMGWERYHTWSSIHSPRGWPDEALCRPPRLVLAELKTETGRVTPAQRRWLALLGACPGVECYLWRPRDLEEVARILAQPGMRVRIT